ncbi:MAG: type I-F CRISPR-associated protein Csy2 [Burkholderiaceae bacterium]
MVIVAMIEKPCHQRLNCMHRLLRASQPSSTPSESNRPIVRPRPPRNGPPNMNASRSLQPRRLAGRNRRTLRSLAVPAAVRHGLADAGRAGDASLGEPVALGCRVARSDAASAPEHFDISHRPRFNRLLVLPRLRVQNANAISSPLTHGFSSITALLGLTWALVGAGWAVCESRGCAAGRPANGRARCCVGTVPGWRHDAALPARVHRHSGDGHVISRRTKVTPCIVRPARALPILAILATLGP